MTLQQLTEHFAIADVLAFSQNEHGLFSAAVTTPICNAELYLQGAHLTRWQPAGHDPVLFLSERSGFVAGKAIRGGIPIIFPWFGPRTVTPGSQRTDGPSHGFARTSEWTLAFAALAGDDLHLIMTLGPSDTSRALGYDDFQLAMELRLGAALDMRLTVANFGTKTLYFEEALHTYLSVGDAQQISILGLADAEYIDKTDDLKRKQQTASPLLLISETDRLYLNTAASVVLEDPTLRRRITVAKSNSNATVVWNPWAELSAKLPDMTPTNWRHMTCIETANAAESIISLPPNEHHTMRARITVEKNAA